MIDCADQAEVDRLWDALLDGGGTPVQCGWLRDRYGLSLAGRAVDAAETVQRVPIEQAPSARCRR